MKFWLSLSGNELNIQRKFKQLNMLWTKLRYLKIWKTNKVCKNASGLPKKNYYCRWRLRWRSLNEKWRNNWPSQETSCFKTFSQSSSDHKSPINMRKLACIKFFGLVSCVCFWVWVASYLCFSLFRWKGVFVERWFVYTFHMTRSLTRDFMWMYILLVIAQEFNWSASCFIQNQKLFGYITLKSLLWLFEKVRKFSLYKIYCVDLSVF